MAVITDYVPATDDLCLYDETNSGQPIAWNTGSPLYAYRSQLRWMRLPYRAYVYESTGYPEPPATSLSQKPNYWNSQKPHLYFAAPRVAFGCRHIWESGVDAARNAALTEIWASQELKFSDSSFGTVTTLANADFIRPWTLQEDNVTRVSNSDVGIFEYGGAVTIDADDCLGVLRPCEIPYGTEGWMLDGNGKVIPIVYEYAAPTVISHYPDADIDVEGGAVRYSSPRLLETFLYDSGDIMFVLHPDSGMLSVVGHVAVGSSSVVSDVPNGYPSSYLASLGAGKTVTPSRWVMEIGSNYATETKAQSIMSVLETIAGEVSP